MSQSVPHAGGRTHAGACLLPRSVDPTRTPRVVAEPPPGRQQRHERDGVKDVPLSAAEMRDGVAGAMWADLALFCRAIGDDGDARERLVRLCEPVFGVDFYEILRALVELVVDDEEPVPPFMLTLSEAQQRLLGADLARLVSAEPRDRVGMAWNICSTLEEWEQEEMQPPTAATPATPGQQRDEDMTQQQELSPVFDEPSPLRVDQRSQKLKPQRAPQPTQEFMRARNALGHCHSPRATAEEARSAAATLKAILEQPVVSGLTRRALQLEIECSDGARLTEDEPPEPEPEPAAVCILRKQGTTTQSGKSRRSHRGRRGRRGKTTKDASSDPKPIVSPVREHEEKERRERPPRRYDKNNEKGQVKLEGGERDKD